MLVAANARQSFVPNPRVPGHRGGASDGSPHHPRIAGGYGTAHMTKTRPADSALLREFRAFWLSSTVKPGIPIWNSNYSAERPNSTF